jgi:Ankyrin repeats (3 copies)
MKSDITPIFEPTEPIHLAVLNGYHDITKLLVEHGTDVNIRDNEYKTPLHCAAFNGNIEIYKYLVEKGADVDNPDEKGVVPLHVAAFEGHLELVKYIVENGELITRPDCYHESMALHYAACGTNVEVVKYLVENGTDIDLRDKSDKTALHYAAECQRADIVKYLIDNGADVSIRNYRSRTPLDIARYTSMFADRDVSSLTVKYLVDRENEITESLYRLNATPITLPEGVEDVITKEDIETGDIIATFHDELKYKRYYKLSTLECLNNRNPLTKKTFSPEDISYYTVTIKTDDQIDEKIIQQDQVEERKEELATDTHIYTSLP